MRKTELGVVIDNVWRGSPAAAAGLLVGDRVLRVGEDAVSEPGDVVAAVAARAAGDRLALQLVRADSHKLVSVQLESKPDTQALLQRLFVGTAAPPLDSLQSAKGSLVPSTNMLAGKVWLLEFWAPWCVACRALGPTLNEWQRELGALGVGIIGITADPFESASTGAAQLELQYDILVDGSGEVTRAYYGTALPTLFVVDRTGIIRDVRVGYQSAALTEIHGLLKQLATRGSDAVDAQRPESEPKR